MSDSYTCAHCHGTFEKAWTDEEANAEAAEVFGEIDDPVVVCDDCYRAMDAVLPMRDWHD